MSSQNKLWVGNIDSKLSEYQLLKLFEAFGKVTAFDFLYTMNTEKGSRTPRGYAFVTFESSDAAKRAIQQLNNKKINGRDLQVRYANSTSTPISSKTVKTTETAVPAVLTAGNSTKSTTSADKLEKIRQLEAKLKILEQDLNIGGKSTSINQSNSRYKPY